MDGIIPPGSASSTNWILVRTLDQESEGRHPVRQTRYPARRAWFEGDGTDARDWLRTHGLIRADGSLTGELR